MKNILGMPLNASSHGGEIDTMMVIIHIFMLVLAVGWGAFFITALVRFRRSKSPKANYTGVKSKLSSYLEVTVVVVECVILLCFALPIWAKVVGDFPAKDKAVQVNVVAEQFAWNFHYAGDDNTFGRRDVKLIDSSNPVGLDKEDPAAADDVVTLNQLYLPKDKFAILNISSKDVIHSFGVYELRVKQDATPGLSIPIWVKPIREGKFDIVCSQLCGIGHYRMKGFANIVSPEAFNAWKKEALEEAADEDDFW